MLKHDQNQLKKRLKRLQPDQRAKFACSTAKRLLEKRNNEVTLTAILKGMIDEDDTNLDDAVIAFMYAVRSFANKNNIEDAFNAALSAYNYAEQQILTNTDSNTKGSEGEIMNHKIIQAELKAQEAELSRLEAE